MVNFWGPVDEPILNDIKSNNEEMVMDMLV